jgi:hypothetical protein
MPDATPAAAMTELDAQTKRYLAAARYFLPEQLPVAAQAAWTGVEHHLHHNDLRRALDSAMSLGNDLRAAKEYWRELLLAARNLELDEHASRLAEWVRTRQNH